MLEVEPALELPVLEDQLLEEAYFDVPMLKDTWNDPVTPVEPVPVNAAVPQIKSSVPALPATVLPNQSAGMNRARNPALAVMFGLAVFVFALVGLIYFFMIPGTTEPAAVGVQAPPARATVNPVPAVLKAAEGTQATSVSDVPAPEVPASPASATAKAPDVPVREATVSKSSPGAAQGSGDCSAALIALSLCSPSTPNQEVKP